MSATTISNHKKPLVLVIEDELVVALSIKKALEKIGYSCICAASRHVLNRKLKHLKPDLIISETDWMARLSLKAFLLNHGLSGKLPIIGLSSSLHATLADSMMMETLSKPFDIDRLQQLVSGYLKLEKRA
jgi:CheY-like chemotaxis protein